MADEREDLRQRVERLEAHLSTLEHRLDLDEMQLAIRNPGRSTAGEGGADGRLELMVRSVLLNQADHTSDLRKAVRYLQVLVERTGSGRSS